MATKKAGKKADPAKVRKETPAKSKKSFTVSFYHDWCKQCGLCMAFCPQKIIKADKLGKPEILDEKRCTGCRFCEMHCPDFAITV